MSTEPFADPAIEETVAPGGPPVGDRDTSAGGASIIDAYIQAPSPVDAWNALRTRLGVVTEHPDVPGLGHPGLPGEHQEAETVEDVGHPTPKAPPTVVVHHIMEAREVGANLIRPRTIRIPAGIQEPVQLLQLNPNRRRALIKVTGSSQAIGVIQGGPGLSSTAAAAANATGGAFFIQATGDPLLEVKATAPVWCALQTGGPCDVTIWEELNQSSVGADSYGGTVDLEGLM